MSHELDTTDGITSFVSANGIDAWHMLGQTREGALTAEEIMEHGYLANWNVRRIPVYAVENGQTIEIEGRSAIVRDNPVNKKVEALGVVGPLYHVVQNEEHAEFLNTLVEESGAHFETAGSLYGGRQVFITMKLPGHMLIGGVDKVDTYIAALNAHDGSKAFTLMATPVRIVCANTLNMAFGNRSHILSRRHTSGVLKAVEKAREALELTFDYLDVFQEEANQLIDTTMTQVQFEEIILSAFGPDEDASQATITRSQNKMDKMVELFTDAGTQKEIRGTAWAGLNAITEWYDHFSTVRGDEPEVSRALNAALDPTSKNKALALIREAVKA
jgi:phage/plasmid-like protein (TIGR03299 family)